jgi:hypothetical protein
MAAAVAMSSDAVRKGRRLVWLGLVQWRAAWLCTAQKEKGSAVPAAAAALLLVLP